MQKKTNIQHEFIIDEDSFGRDYLEQLAQRVLRWVKITKKGEVVFQSEGRHLSPDDKLRFALTARYVGHHFSEEISAELKVLELRNVINESSEATGSRMSRLDRKENFARKVKYGTYAVRPHQIEKFIEGLETRSIVKHQ